MFPECEGYFLLERGEILELRPKSPPNLCVSNAKIKITELVKAKINL